MQSEMPRESTKMRTRLAVGFIALASGALAAAACGSGDTSQPPQELVQLRIFDATNKSRIRVTMSDVIRSSARAESGETAESGLLYFRLTRAGVLKFRRLTHELAKRGKRIHRVQAFTLKINNRVYARPTVDYNVFPSGLDASQGLEISGLTFGVTRRLANQIRKAS